MPAPRIRCEELRPDLWPVVEALFGPGGACGGCWCMWWRVERGGALWERTKGEPARRAFRRLVERGEAMGVLAFAGDDPVGWCAFGPREQFPRVDRIRAFRDVPARGAWSINCFFIARGWRGRGVARRLLDAAVAGCRRRGARVIEGYPVTGDSVSAAFAWTGPAVIFEERGFEAVSTPPSSRALVRLRVRGGPRRKLAGAARSGTLDG